MDEDFNNEYYIPQNYTDSGKVFRGMFELRNLIEAIAVAVIIGVPEYFLIQTSGAIKITIMIVSVLPFAILALAGIDGESLSQYGTHIFLYIKQKRVLHFKRVGGKKVEKEKN